LPDPGYVGFQRRLAAFAIDALLVFVLVAPLALFGIGGFLVETLVPAVAVLAFWRAWGATPGKIALGAKVVDARGGGAPTLLALAVRYAAYFLSMLPLFLGFAWIAIDRRKQGWHDKIARTVVIDDDD
jgi:uncharacterized RDD family membrane protein YckC